MVLQKVMVSSKTNEWETPQFLFNKLDNEFNFTLDVAATKKNTKCNRYFDKENDGLIQDWNKEASNHHIWMNPPYGGHTGKWIKKAYEEGLKGNVIVCLIVSSTDRSYWHDYIFPYASEIRFLRGRLKFGEAKYSAPFASAIVIFNGVANQSQPKIIFYKNE